MHSWEPELLVRLVADPGRVRWEASYLVLWFLCTKADPLNLLEDWGKKEPVPTWVLGGGSAPWTQLI